MNLSITQSQCLGILRAFLTNKDNAVENIGPDDAVIFRRLINGVASEHGREESVAAGPLNQMELSAAKLIADVTQRSERDASDAAEIWFFASAMRILTNGHRPLGTHQADDDQLLKKLTPREREVLTWIAYGLSNKEIASRFNISVRTIETHRERIMRKLDIHSVAGLTRCALSMRLLPLEGDLRQAQQAVTA